MSERTAAELAALLREHTERFYRMVWDGNPPKDMKDAADALEKLAAQVAELTEKGALAAAAARQLFLTGDKLIEERSEAWRERDAAIEENAKLRHAIRLLTYAPVGGIRESAEVRAALTDAAAWRAGGKEMLGEVEVASEIDEEARRTA